VCRRLLSHEPLCDEALVIDVKTYLAKAILVALAAAVLCNSYQSAQADPRVSASEPTAATAPADHEGRALRPPESASGRGDLEDRPVGGGGDGWIGGYLQTLLALGAVIGLIFITRILIRRFGPSQGSIQGHQPLTVLARTNLGARRQLLIVRFGARVLLIGSGPDGLRGLCEVTDQEEVDEILKVISGSEKGPASPSGGRKRASGNPGDPEERR